jgi:hypothetical protein
MAMAESGGLSNAVEILVVVAPGLRLESLPDDSGADRIDPCRAMKAA